MNLHFRQSTAVMARRFEPATSLDYFPTPPWATRALCEVALPQIDAEPGKLFTPRAHDPACGEGHMAGVLGEYFHDVTGADIFDYGGNLVADFLHPDTVHPDTDWIVTNPPFNQAAEFVLQARRIAKTGVAILGRTALLEGDGRFRSIYREDPPTAVFQFVERVPMHRGRWVVNGSTATAYCWLVWLAEPDVELQRAAPLFRFIPPCRRQLTKHDDWLNFGGCMDIPKTHTVNVLRAEWAKEKREFVADITDLRMAA